MFIEWPGTAIGVAAPMQRGPQSPHPGWVTAGLLLMGCVPSIKPGLSIRLHGHDPSFSKSAP